MVLISNCRECVVNAGDYLKRVLYATATATCEAARQIGDLANKIIAIAIPTLLLFGFPGSFIAGVSIGIIFPEKSEKIVQRIIQIWKKQSPFIHSAIVFFTLYGLPYTPYLAAAVFGAKLGSQQALQTMGDGPFLI